ncbi:hypothetical protein [Brucella anthropi]|nr:hypothetical protein [Brucella anthropi]
MRFKIEAELLLCSGDIALVARFKFFPLGDISGDIVGSTGI